MEALCVRPLIADGVVMEEEELERSGRQEEGGTEASSPTGSTTDEDTDEEEEAEPPPVVCRKVSFADAFGLNLVSVKEFDNVEATVSEVSRPPDREAAFPLEEFYMSCLFTVSSSPEELAQRLQAQMVELESVELLPGTTVLRGIVRVVNLGYSKSVYARISLDRWSSYFDLYAEYVPGSSDRDTDRFAFNYTLIPPFDRKGSRVDFCLCYETTAGTFWANNRELNYVLFCYQRGQAKELGPQVLEESSGYRRSKRSCLKANRRGGAEEKTKESNSTATLSAGAQAAQKAQEADRQAANSTETRSLLHHDGHKALVDGVKSWQRGACLTRLQDEPSQRRPAPRVYSRDSAGGQKIPPPVPAPWCDSASNRYNRQKKPSDSPQILTYHQIPLLTLDWKSDTPQRRGAADMDDMWAGNAKLTGPKASVENVEDTPSVNDLWESFLNSADDTGDKDTSVCDVWQEFLNQPSREDHSGVPEAEWLQTAALVSPSNHREPQYSASSQAFQEVQVGTDAPALHASAAASSSSDHQPHAEACVCDNTATQDAPQRAQTNSVTHTPQEFSLEGAKPVSSVDTSTECHLLAIWERVGKRGDAEGAGGDEHFPLPTADLVTSSGESKTADTTETPESQNASAVDRISQRARLDEGLSSGGEGEVTGTAHNATCDTLAFRETIRQGTEDGERFVFSTSRERAGEGRITTNCINVEQQEINPPAQSTHNVELKVLQCNTFPADRHILNPAEVEESRLESSQDVMRGRREGAGREMSPEEMTVKENVLPATIEGAEESTRLRDEDERRLKTDAMRGSMGNVEDPRVERKNTSGELKEREKVENPQHVECRKSSDLVVAEKTEALESRVEEAFIERFGEDFVRGIWEEVFGRRAWDTGDITCDRHPRLFSSTDPNLRIHQGEEEAIETSSKEQSPEGNQTHATDLDSSAPPTRELNASSTEPARTISSAKEQENVPQMRKRSITRQETGGQTEDFNRSAQQLHKHPAFPPERLRWSLHVLRHLTRLLLCTLLVAGFFTILFLYDFPAFIALYVFSGCWWFYKWRRHRVALDKRVGGEEEREGVEECGA